MISEAAPRFPEQPVLCLGAAGLSPAERAALAEGLAAYDGNVAWQLSAFSDADAWVIAGSKVRVVSENTIAVHPGRPTENLVRLDLADATRPVMFAKPLPDALDAPCKFDLRDRAELASALRDMERWLKALRTKFALGRDVVRHGESLRHGVFHVFWKERLLAVLNFRTGQAGLAAFAAPEMIPEAVWKKRPPSAGELPPGFGYVPTRELAWIYVRHAAADLLPTRYKGCTIYYRGPARVPVNSLSDAQLLILRELAESPGTLRELHHRTALALTEIERSLAGLYYAGCITGTPTKAGALSKPSSASQMSSSQHALADILADGDARALQAPTRRDATVPAGLGPT